MTRIRERPEYAVRAAMILAWALGMVWIVGGPPAFGIPAGVIFLAAGCLMAFDAGGILAGLNRFQRRWRTWPAWAEYRRFHGWLFVVVGALWTFGALWETIN